jgi:hypothetical protein
MTVLVGFVPTAEGEVAFAAGLDEARRRGEDLLVLNSPRDGAPLSERQRANHQHSARAKRRPSASEAVR